MTQNTKQAIADAYLALAQEKAIDKITVKDVVAACDITRQTFYYHFRDLWDVVEWILACDMEALLAKVLTTDVPREGLRLLVTGLQGRSHLITRLLASRHREEMERTLMRTARRFLAALMRERQLSATTKYASDIEVALTFYSCAIGGVLAAASQQTNVHLDVLVDQLDRLLCGELAFRASDAPKRP